jgi:hypothetical protein
MVSRGRQFRKAGLCKASKKSDQSQYRVSERNRCLLRQIVASARDFVPLIAAAEKTLMAQ